MGSVYSPTAKCARVGSRVDRRVGVAASAGPFRFKAGLQPVHERWTDHYFWDEGTGAVAVAGTMTCRVTATW